MASLAGRVPNLRTRRAARVRAATLQCVRLVISSPHVVVLADITEVLRFRLRRRDSTLIIVIG